MISTPPKNEDQLSSFLTICHTFDRLIKTMHTKERPPTSPVMEKTAPQEVPGSILPDSKLIAPESLLTVCEEKPIPTIGLFENSWILVCHALFRDAVIEPIFSLPICLLTSPSENTSISGNEIKTEMLAIKAYFTNLDCRFLNKKNTCLLYTSPSPRDTR